MKVPIEQVKLNPNNPRVIKDEKFKKLVKSLKDFPEMAEVREIIVNKDNVILGGNMRLRAMKEAGWTEVPIRVVDWSEEKQKEFVIKDNSSFGEWDWEQLANQYEAEQLQDWGLDLPNMFDKVIEDEPPKLQEGEAVSKLGEVYQIGKHRVICGDATDYDTVKKLFGDKKAKVVFTSPPYNMARGLYREYEDNKAPSEYIEFNLTVYDIWKQFTTGYIFWNLRYNKNNKNEFFKVLSEITDTVGTQFLELITWDKGHAIPITAKEMVTRISEVILLNGVESDEVSQEIEHIALMGTDNRRAWFRKEKGISNYWRIDTNKAQTDNHKACFPVNLPAKGIQMCSDESDIISDPFLGTGSTLIASEQLNRICYGAELDPHYCDVIRKRYQKLVTGSEDGWEEATKAISGVEQEQKDAI
jgi:DNA modification methylase